MSLSALMAFKKQLKFCAMLFLRPEYFLVPLNLLRHCPLEKLADTFTILAPKIAAASYLTYVKLSVAGFKKCY